MQISDGSGFAARGGDDGDASRTGRLENEGGLGGARGRPDEEMVSALGTDHRSSPNRDNNVGWTHDSVERVEAPGAFGGVGRGVGEREPERESGPSVGCPHCTPCRGRLQNFSGLLRVNSRPSPLI